MSVTYVSLHLAIGRSTNLITPDSNIIVIRGGARPVHDQINNALLRFFPESMDQSTVGDRKAKEEHTIPLQRITTGVSLVGADNGDRPGGFVLVIDGAALLQVSSPLAMPGFGKLKYTRGFRRRRK